MFEKLKSWFLDDTVYLSSLLVLVGICSFGLGRLSVLPVPSTATSVPIGLVASPIAAPTALQPIVATTSSSTHTDSALVNGEAMMATSSAGAVLPYVASKSGTKYHRIDCPGAKQIKTENKIYFTSEASAAAAGYTRAANCPAR